MNQIYKIMKVFDCQWNPGMPKDVKKAFFDVCKSRNYGNDVWISWTINDEAFDDEDSEWAKNKRKVDSWLIENGAEPAINKNTEGETVLIKHWW